MRNWLAAQYDDIKGNLKWALLAGLWWLAVRYGRKMLELIPNIPSWAVTLILLVVSLIVFLWIAKSGTKMRAGKNSVQAGQITTANTSKLTTVFPSLSSLTGQAPNVTFNPTEWFRHAYFSPLTAEIEQNIRTVARQTQDSEGFYAS